MKALTPQQQRFAEAYALGNNATEAARIAKYSAKRPDVAAAKLLKNKAVLAEVARLRKESAERTGVSIDWVTEKLVHVVNSCMQKRAVYDRRGRKLGDAIVDSNGANRALELLGKTRGMFDTKIKVETPEGTKSAPGGTQVVAVVNVSIGA
jgi:hypothetical protein